MSDTTHCWVDRPVLGPAPSRPPFEPPSPSPRCDGSTWRRWTDHFLTVTRPQESHYPPSGELLSRTLGDRNRGGLGGPLSPRDRKRGVDPDVRMVCRPGRILPEHEAGVTPDVRGEEQRPVVEVLTSDLPPQSRPRDP